MSNNSYEFYCPKCGDTHFINNNDNRCVICGNTMIETPHEYNLSQDLIDEILKMGWNDHEYILEEHEKKFYNEVICQSPEFDQYLYEHHDEILQRKSAEYNVQIARGKAILEEENKVPKCITCGSTNIRKIGALERGASIVGFGLFSKKINKTFKCNNCGCTW